jgi:hypothetical protein
MSKRQFKTDHRPGQHVGIMDDGVWATEKHTTEIGLVQELGQLGFNIKNYRCTHTEVHGAESEHKLTHTWSTDT